MEIDLNQQCNAREKTYLMIFLAMIPLHFIMSDGRRNARTK